MKTLREYIEIVENLHDTSDEEYSDEVGMANTDLSTIMRACRELSKTLVTNEDLPEWVQEKLVMAKQNITTIRDYMISQHEQGKVM